MSQFVFDNSMHDNPRASLDSHSLSSLYDELDSFIHDLEDPSQAPGTSSAPTHKEPQATTEAKASFSQGVMPAGSTESLDSSSSVEIQTFMVGHKYQLSPDLAKAPAPSSSGTSSSRSSNQSYHLTAAATSSPLSHPANAANPSNPSATASWLSSSSSNASSSSPTLSNRQKSPPSSPPMASATAAILSSSSSSGRSSSSSSQMSSFAPYYASISPTASQRTSQASQRTSQASQRTSQASPRTSQASPQASPAARHASPAATSPYTLPMPFTGATFSSDASLSSTGASFSSNAQPMGSPPPRPRAPPPPTPVAPNAVPNASMSSPNISKTSISSNSLPIGSPPPRPRAPPPPTPPTTLPQRGSSRANDANASPRHSGSQGSTNGTGSNASSVNNSPYMAPRLPPKDGFANLPPKQQPIPPSSPQQPNSQPLSPSHQGAGATIISPMPTRTTSAPHAAQQATMQPANVHPAANSAAAAAAASFAVQRSTSLGSNAQQMPYRPMVGLPQRSLTSAANSLQSQQPSAGVLQPRTSSSSSQGGNSPALQNRTMNSTSPAPQFRSLPGSAPGSPPPPGVHSVKPAAFIPRTSSLAKDTLQRSDSLSSYRSNVSSASSLSLAGGQQQATPAIMSPPLAKINETRPLNLEDTDTDNDDDEDEELEVQKGAMTATAASVTISAPSTTTTTMNDALLSELVANFASQVHLITSRRKIFTTAEYPKSFNGEEAVDMIRSILPDELPESMYLKVTRALMHTTPPVIAPITYSEKSTRRNTLYQSSHEVYQLVDDGIPQGVYTPLTQCYSPTCSRDNAAACYAPCCPNRPAVDLTIGLERRNSFESSVASSHDTTVSRAWSATVSKDLLQNTPPKEIARQEAIHELIYTEEDYVRDLNLLDELFAKALREAQCIEVERRDAFCDYIFNNYLELLSIHRDLYRDLRDHQCLCQANTVGGFVDKVGDIFLRHAHRFMAAYKRYGPHVVLAEYSVKKEMATNMLFQNFIHAVEKQPELRKLPFRHFIILPVTRLQRYPLLIGAILKKTPEDHPDHEILEECLDVLKRVASTMDSDTVGTKNILRVHQINDAIRCKPAEPIDLQLSFPQRQLLHEGPLTRRNHMVGDPSEIYVFLFDHMLIMTRRRRVQGPPPPHTYNEDEYEYHISKRPIPMPLLLLEEATEGFALGIRTMSSKHSTTLTSRSGTLVNSLAYGSNTHPLVLQHLGRMGGDYLLFAENAASRLAWKEHIVNAKAALEEQDPSRQVFKIMSLSDATFRTSYQFGKVTCSVQFEGTKGIRMIAVGTVAGVWMGIEGDTNSIRQVLAIEDVTQMAVLPAPHILVVLADKTLYAYALEALDPTARKTSNDKPFQRIAQSISYFNAGVCNGRPLVIAMKKRGLDSHFKAFEPVCGDLRDPANSRFLTTKTGLFGKTHAWFRVHKEFYVGADSSAVHFLKARVVVVCPRGFEVIDLDNLHLNRNIPDLSQPDFAFVTQRTDVLPLGFFKCRQHYLLCYNTFAFLVDTHGNFVQENYAWIAWEGTPQAIAFYYPYIVAFDHAFIEIRHVETGELVQIIAGVQMRCLQFTNDTFAPVVHGCMTHPFKPDFQYVFQLMANFEPVTLYPNSPMPRHR